MLERRTKLNFPLFASGEMFFPGLQQSNRDV
jgi:hypothetical protein